MNETKQIKFPIAAVFSTLNVLIGLINIFVTYTTYTRIIGIPTVSYTHLTLPTIA